MKFFFAKSTHTCIHCKTDINQSEPFVRVGSKMGMLLHPECYPTWNEQSFNRRYMEWIRKNSPPRKCGHPRKYKDIKAAHRLLALRYFHQKRGNDTRVMEIQAKLDENLV